MVLSLPTIDSCSTVDTVVVVRVGYAQSRQACQASVMHATKPAGGIKRARVQVRQLLQGAAGWLFFGDKNHGSRPHSRILNTLIKAMVLFAKHDPPDLYT